jgi:hypothetical protein
MTRNDSKPALADCVAKNRARKVLRINIRLVSAAIPYQIYTLIAHRF